MPLKTKLTRPPTLEPGKVYLRRIAGLSANELLPIRFVNYSACPEMIIVWNGSERERCPRRELYSINPHW